MNRINRRILWIFLPLAAGFLLFYLIPLIGSVRYSLVENAFEQRFVGWKNYAETLANRNFRLSVKNTAILLAMGVPLVMIVALGLALLIRWAGKDGAWMRAAILLPMLLPSTAVAQVFLKLPLGGERMALTAVYVWKNAGFLALILQAALNMIPKEVYEAAALDGAGRFRQLLSMTLPMIAGAMAFATVLAVCYNLRLFREAYLMYGAYPDESVYLTQHYMNNHFYKLNYQRLTAAATLFAAGLFTLVGLGLKLARRMGRGE